MKGWRVAAAAAAATVALVVLPAGPASATTPNTTIGSPANGQTLSSSSVGISGSTSIQPGLLGSNAITGVSVTVTNGGGAAAASCSGSSCGATLGKASTNFSFQPFLAYNGPYTAVANVTANEYGSLDNPLGAAPRSSSASTSFKVATKPAAPHGVSAQANSDRTVTVTWARNAEPDIVAYQVQRQSPTSSQYSPAANVAQPSGSTVSWTDPLPAQNGGTFRYVIIAARPNGDGSTASPLSSTSGAISVDVPAPPPPPTVPPPTDSSGGVVPIATPTVTSTPAPAAAPPSLDLGSLLGSPAGAAGASKLATPGKLAIPAGGQSKLAIPGVGTPPETGFGMTLPFGQAPQIAVPNGGTGGGQVALGGRPVSSSHGRTLLLPFAAGLFLCVAGLHLRFFNRHFATGVLEPLAPGGDDNPTGEMAAVAVAGAVQTSGRAGLARAGAPRAQPGLAGASGVGAGATRAQPGAGVGAGANRAGPGLSRAGAAIAPVRRRLVAGAAKIRSRIVPLAGQGVSALAELVGLKASPSDLPSQPVGSKAPRPKRAAARNAPRRGPDLVSVPASRSGMVQATAPRPPDRVSAPAVPATAPSRRSDRISAPATPPHPSDPVSSPATPPRPSDPVSSPAQSAGRPPTMISVPKPSDLAFAPAGPAGSRTRRRGGRAGAPRDAASVSRQRPSPDAVTPGAPAAGARSQLDVLGGPAAGRSRVAYASDAAASPPGPSVAGVSRGVSAPRSGVAGPSVADRGRGVSAPRSEVAGPSDAGSSPNLLTPRSGVAGPSDVAISPGAPAGSADEQRIHGDGAGTLAGPEVPPGQLSAGGTEELSESGGAAGQLSDRARRQPTAVRRRTGGQKAAPSLSRRPAPGDQKSAPPLSRRPAPDGQKSAPPLSRRPAPDGQVSAPPLTRKAPPEL